MKKRMSMINWPLLAVIAGVVVFGVLVYFGLVPGWSNVW